jgi:hypothetical protein
MLLVIALSIASCTDNSDNPVVNTTLEEALANTHLFSDIKENPDKGAMEKKKKGELDYLSQYSMFIEQPVNHNQPDADKFKQKVSIMFRGFDRPTILVTEGYLWEQFRDAEDIGINLKANMVHVEHRNFGESFNQDRGKWEFETSAQASADLHAVYLALKPIFKGKWMSTGTSKSGETSIDYAYYYPGDMDLAAAFCSPFNLSLDDKRYGEYLFNKLSTKELRDIMKEGVRSALKDGEEGVYKKACEEFKKKNMPVPSFAEYVYNVFDTFFSVFQYTLPSKQKKGIESIVETESSLVAAICDNIADLRNKNLYTYFVDCAKEQGFPNVGYDYFADLLEGTSFKAEDVLPSVLHSEDRWLVKYYDNSVRTDMAKNFFVNSTVPLLFYYSQDDPWSAGKPEKIGPNARMIINPIGVHRPKINDPAYCPADVKQEVMDYIRTYIY